MRKLIIACAVLIGADVAEAQPYVPAPNFGYPVTAPGSVAPQAPPSGFALPGYQWREQRGDSDWRNNTWREDRIDEDWRNKNWQTRRALDDWQQRQDYSKIRTPNNATDRGYVECGKGSVGSSSPCANYARESPTERSEIADENEKRPANERKGGVARGVEDCGYGLVWRRC